MSAIRPKVTRTFWEQLQNGWRKSHHSSPTFPDYQRNLFSLGMNKIKLDSERLNQELHYHNSHLKPRQVTLSVDLNDKEIGQVRSYANGVYTVQSKEDVVATIIKIGLEH